MLVAALSSSSFAAPLVVNELFRSGNLTSTDEWVELVLTQDLTAAELELFSVGDSTSSTEAKFSGYRFTAMGDFADVFPAGTVLVVTGTTGPTADFDYDPATGDWNLVLPTSDLHLTGNGSSGDLASTDVVYVDADGTNGSTTLTADGFAVCWDTSPGLLGALAVPIGVPANLTGAALDAAVEDALDPVGWLTSLTLDTMTPGAPNGGANGASIEALRCVDPDADGVCDPADTCPADADPTNADTDGDGVGDVCDGCTGVDTDGDDLCDDVDTCPADADPTNADTDGDGIGDLCDLPLALTIDPVVPGALWTATVTDALPGDLVTFGMRAGTGGAGPCPVILGGLCLDFGGPVRVISSATADEFGVATVSRTLSAGLVPGASYTFQAATARGVGGIGSAKSQAITAVVQ